MFVIITIELFFFVLEFAQKNINLVESEENIYSTIAFN